jgi:hypothetical protein
LNDGQILDTLRREPWRWHSYNDVAEQMGKRGAWGEALALLIKLAKDPASPVVGRKEGKSKRIPLDQFRVAPANTRELNGATKAERLVRIAQWITAFVAQNPRVSGNQAIEAVAKLIGRFDRLEALAIIKVLEAHGVLERDRGKLCRTASPIPAKAVYESLAAWYELGRGRR